MEENKIYFKNLSKPLKMCIVLGTIAGLAYLLAFFMGFLVGIVESV